MRFYTTRYYGAPYGRGGERGPDTSTPGTVARHTLHPGQRLDCFRVGDVAQTTPVVRYAADPQGFVCEIDL